MRNSMGFSIVGLVAMVFSTITTQKARAELPSSIDRGTLVGDAQIEKVLVALGQPVSVDFQKIPLINAIAILEKRSGLDIEIDARGLTQVGADMADPVSLSVKEISLRSVLNLLLNNIELDATIRHGKLTVTSTEESESSLATRIYHVENFVKPDNDWDTLIEMITMTIHPISWEDVGGRGSIKLVTNRNAKMLIIKQTFPIHDEIGRLFSALRLLERRAAMGKPLPRILNDSQSTNGPSTKINTALAKKITLNLSDTPLDQFVDHLRKSTGLNVYLDRRALDDIGVPTDFPITFRAKEIPWETALRIALSQEDLTSIIWNEVLTITSIEMAESHPIVGVYDVTDLVQSEDGEALIEMIMSTIDPTTWDVVGGIGSLFASPRLPHSRLLVIAQTGDTHDEIGRLFSALRLLERRAAMGKPLPRILNDSQSTNGPSTKINTALAKKITLNLSDTPLDQFVDHLRKSTGLNVYLDRRALDVIGVPTDFPITFRAKEIPWETALRIALSQEDLTSIIWNEVLTITSIEMAESHPIVGVYDVTDLDQSKDGEALIEIIMSMIEPTTWDVVGGIGSLFASSRSPHSQLLVIAQTGDTHDKINTLLETLRRETSKPIGKTGLHVTSPSSQ